MVNLCPCVACVAGIGLETQRSSSFLTDAQRQALDAALADKSPQTGITHISCHPAPFHAHLKHADLSNNRRPKREALFSGDCRFKHVQ